MAGTDRLEILHAFRSRCGTGNFSRSARQNRAHRRSGGCAHRAATPHVASGIADLSRRTLHRLAHATRVRSWLRHCHRHRDKNSRQQKYQQRSSS